MFSNKESRPHVVARLRWTSTLKWCMARLVVDNIHQKDMCQDEIEIFCSKFNNEHNCESPLYVCEHFWFWFFLVLFFSFKYFTLTFYNFYTSTMLLKTAQNNARVIRFCWHDGTTPDSIRLRKLCVEMEEVPIDRRTFIYVHIVQVHFAASLTSGIHQKSLTRSQVLNCQLLESIQFTVITFQKPGHAEKGWIVAKFLR